jgi:hypothetical protein
MDGLPVVWAMRKQPIVTKSTTAAEYVAASETTNEATFVAKLLDGLGIQCRPIPLVCDNQAATHLISNPIDNGLSKYLAVHWHFVRERHAEGDVRMVWADTNQQLADGMTKAFNGAKMTRFRESLGLRK